MALSDKEFQNSLDDLPEEDQFDEPKADFDNAELLKSSRFSSDDSEFRPGKEHLVKVPVLGAATPEDVSQITDDILFDEYGKQLFNWFDRLGIEPHVISNGWWTTKEGQTTIYLVMLTFIIGEYEFVDDIEQELSRFAAKTIKYMPPEQSAKMVAQFSR